MKQRMAFILFTVLFLGIVSGCMRETPDTQGWPQYLGPHRNGTSDLKGLLRAWPKEGPKILWSTNLGIGFGGPVAKDGKVYLLDRDDKVGDTLRCFDLSSGKELWDFGYTAAGTVMFPGSRSVPTLDGNYVYSCGHNGDLYCIDINTRKPVWNKNVWKDYGGDQLPMWAITQCPFVYGNLLIIASQAPQAGVVAYDKLTGDLKWKTPSLGGVGYTSPSVLKVAGEDQIVMLSAEERGFPGGQGGRPSGQPPRGAQGQGRPPQGGQGGPPQGFQEPPVISKGKIVGINPLSGNILWQYEGWQCHIPVPCAIDAGDGKVLVTGGYQAGAVMLKIEKKTDGTFGVTELFKNPDFGCHTQPPVLYNGYFYGQCSTNESKNGLVCMSIDGETRWKTGRKPLFDKGGSILVDGLMLSTDGRSKLYLIQPDPSAFKPMASADVLKEGVPGSKDDSMETRFGGSTQNWAPLALSAGKLLIRDQNRLICIKVFK